MSTVWENSYVDRLRTLLDKKGHVPVVVENVRHTIEPLILPDAAKVLTAIATDLMTAVQTRNDRADVNDACAALRAAIALLEAVDQSRWVRRTQF
jgi:hypothetical protein